MRIKFLDLFPHFEVNSAEWGYSKLYVYVHVQNVWPSKTTPQCKRESNADFSNCERSPNEMSPVIFISHKIEYGFQDDSFRRRSCFSTAIVFLSDA